AFFDMDGDGDLDLFVSNTAKWTYDTRDPSNRYYEGAGSLTELVACAIEPNLMYRNEGNGKFTDVTAAAGLEGVGWGGDVAVFDFDGDGDLDLFVANMFGQSLLYRNDGNGRFTSCAQEVFGRTSWGAVGAKAFDYDVDGRLDLLVIDMHSDMWIQASIPYEMVRPTTKFATALGPSRELNLITEEAGADLIKLLRAGGENLIFGTTLFHNLGGGKFEETSDRAGVETFFPWSAGVGDYDCDGSEDVFIATGMGHPFRYWPASLLMNDGHGRFTNRAKELGIDPPPGGVNIDGLKFLGKDAAKSSRATAVADFDGDGRLDIAVNNFNDRAHLFRNLLPKRHWVSLRLKATRGHPDAVGALVTLKAGGRTMVRQVNTSGGYLSQGSRALHFGLGDNVKIESCEIRWPGGQRQTLTDIAIDQVHAITEPAK
ncbi:MAG: CRTAC1 family protein, partial [Planctomycetes bacterium]|nr:CRTAC1 family protein [Planctomycetota bacterium]